MQVGVPCLELDRASAGVHRVVDEIQRGLHRCRLARQAHAHRHRAARMRGLEPGQFGLGHGETDVDRLHLVEHHQIGAVGADLRAGIHQRRTGDAVERRADRGIAQLGARQFHRRLIGLHRGGIQAGVGLGGVVGGFGHIAVFQQRAVAPEQSLRIGVLRLVAGQVALRLVQLRLQQAGVEADEGVAAGDMAAGLERQGLQLAADARLHGHRGPRLRAADHLQRKIDVATLRRGDPDRHDLGGWSRLRARRVSTPAPELLRSETDEQQHDCRQQQFPGVFLRHARSGHAGSTGAWARRHDHDIQCSCPARDGQRPTRCR